MIKSLIITIDTEGDNLWGWKQGQPITTINSQYIPRFQSLCEEYGFKPVYLTNYEMASDESFAKYVTSKAKANLCEIGMHLHAWNTPPEYKLTNKFGGNPYITEYPPEVIERKASYIYSYLTGRFDIDIVSHRSGRWATNTTYLNILKKLGIYIDCSVTPQVDLSRLAGCSINGGNDYTQYSVSPSEIVPGLLEVPMSTRRVHFDDGGSLKHRIRVALPGCEVWLRPISKSFSQLINLEKHIERENKSDYLELMLHSSELMPGGSPYFKTEDDIEQLYKLLKQLFCHYADKKYGGLTLQEYAKFKGYTRYGKTHINILLE